MSDITVIKQILKNESLENSEIISRLQKSIGKQFDNFKQTGPSTFNARVKTRIFNPIVSIVGNINVIDNGKTTTLELNADMKTNAWFWFTILVQFVTPLIGWGLLLIWWMWGSQKKKSIKALEDSFEKSIHDLSISGFLGGTQVANHNPIDNIEAIENLHQLKVSGALSEEEYQIKKSKLIA
jgi:hypothetical protein